MGKKKIFKWKYKSFILGNLKWAFFVFLGMLLIIFITTPLYVWLDMDWIMHLPPLYFIGLMMYPITICIVIGTMMRTIWYLYKEKRPI